MRRRVVIALGEDELIWLRRIITDEDRGEALKFIGHVIDAKVQEKLATKTSLDVENQRG